MNICTKILVIMFALQLGHGVTLAKDFDVGEVKGTDFPQWFRKSEFMDLTDNLAEARSGGKKGLMVLFTTEGCSYCSVFIERSLHDESIAEIVKANFDAIGFEIFDDAEIVSPAGKSMPVKVFARSEGVMYSPTVIFYDSEGKQVFRKTGYLSPERFRETLDYVINGHYRSGSFAEYKQRQGPKTVAVRAVQSLLENAHFDQPPYALDRSRFPASKPLLVLFESRTCESCRNFHEKVLKDEQVDKTLSQFQVVRFDAGDNKTPVLAPDGNRTTPADWFAKAGFTQTPAMILVDPKGNESMKTDALVLQNRMMNSLNYMLEKAYEKGWTYQRFARSKSIARSLEKQKASGG